MTQDTVDKLAVLTDLAEVVVSAVRERLVSEDNARDQLNLIFTETTLILKDSKETEKTLCS